MGLKNMLRKWLEIPEVETPIPTPEAVIPIDAETKAVAAIVLGATPPEQTIDEDRVKDALVMAQVITAVPKPIVTNNKRYGNGRPSDTKIACIVDPNDPDALLRSMSR
jgi:hypothetical protein